MFVLLKSAGYIQELLGNKSNKTTEIYPAQFYPALLNGAWIHCARVYTHVSKSSIGKIISPLDRLEEEKSDKYGN
ncbi:unnamed protein product [marine sediment metagenome]|uniref:Uncharacterized protein n=1 Tax=marine sediment metagenome TaxID=412755 RepID=X1IQ46_9ZZZZ